MYFGLYSVWSCIINKVRYIVDISPIITIYRSTIFSLNDIRYCWACAYYYIQFAVKISNLHTFKWCKFFDVGVKYEFRKCFFFASFLLLSFGCVWFKIMQTDILINDSHKIAWLHHRFCGWWDFVYLNFTYSNDNK